MKGFVELLAGVYNIYAVVLFGSHAEGSDNEFSDIDLAVFSEQFGKDLFQKMKTMFKIRRKIDTDIEPLPFKKDQYFEHGPSDFVSEILKKGKLLFREGKFLM